MYIYVNQGESREIEENIGKLINYKVNGVQFKVKIATTKIVNWGKMCLIEVIWGEMWWFEIKCCESR